MADIVNLRQARKAKARSDKAEKAGENRAKFGRTAAEKKRDEATAALQKRRLDHVKLEQD